MARNRCTHGVTLLFSLLVVLSLQPGCGGGQSAAREPEEPAADATHRASEEQRNDQGDASVLGLDRVPAWDAATRDKVCASVRSQAIVEFKRLHPGAAFEDAKAFSPTSPNIPALGDEAVELMLHLAVAELSCGTPAQTLSLIDTARAKAANRHKAYSGVTLYAEAVRREAAATGGEPAARERLRALLQSLPDTPLREVAMLIELFQEQDQLNARMMRLGNEPQTLDEASRLLVVREVLSGVVANRKLYAELLGEIQRAARDGSRAAANGSRTVTSVTLEQGKPVAVVVWDTGVATDKFATQLLPELQPAQPLQSPDPSVIERYAGNIEGIFELDAGLSTSPAASRVLSLMQNVSQDVSARDLGYVFDALRDWARGTHEASLLMQGNPFARLGVIRSDWLSDHRYYSEKLPTAAQLAEERAQAKLAADALKKHNVRIVVLAADTSKAALLARQATVAVSAAQDAVSSSAEHVHKQRAALWAEVFRAAPKTLFIVPAGNGNADIAKNAELPASLNALNLLVVGALDSAGRWAEFTNFASAQDNKRNMVYAPGIRVAGLLPTGKNAELTGTAIAAAAAARTAAKVLAVKPTWTPARVIAHLAATGDAIAAPYHGVAVNEDAALKQLK